MGIFEEQFFSNTVSQESLSSETPALQKNALKEAQIYCLEAFHLLLQPWCLSYHHQSISSILLSYELIRVTREWFIIYSKASRKLFYFKLQGKWISLLLSRRNYLSSIFQLKVTNERRQSGCLLWCFVPIVSESVLYIVVSQPVQDLFCSPLISD